MGSGLCCPADELLNRAHELQPLRLQFELERPPALKLEKVHDRFLSLLPSRSTRSNLAYADFVRVLGIGDTPLLQRTFKLIDLNESKGIDFLEFLSGCWNLCTLQDDKNLLRFLFQLYATQGQAKIEVLKEMVSDLHGENFTAKMWIPLRSKMENSCTHGKCSWKEFKELIRDFNTVLLPAFSLRDELRESFFGVELWSRGALIRRRSNTKYNQEDILKLQMQMSGIGKASKKADSKKNKPPEKHKSQLRGSVVIGRSTIAKHYKVTMRAESFDAKKDMKIRGRPDKSYALPRTVGC